MKTWEKILRYPIGLYLWLTDGIKKMSKKRKPAMAMLMVVVMLCGMLPATAIAGTNDDEADLLERLGVEGEVQLAELDGGKYIAVYLDDDDSRDSYNNQAAYYAIYDGIWQRPYILEDDGTKDYMPTISDLGNGQLFIAWGTASKTFDANTKEYAALSATDIVGVFVDKATGNISEVLEVTYETEDDVYGDENPRAAYDEATGRLMIWYNKCEYSDESDPYSVLSYRLYDMQVKEFQDLGDSPDGDWYGQVLVGVDPAVTVEETLDASGYWAEPPEFTEFDGWDSCAVEFDAIQFNGQSLLAYAIDYDLNRSTTDDRDVYVLAYNFEDNSITHPIMITNTDAAESNVEFRDVDGKLCLSYLSDGQEITFNISDNFSNANVLKEDVTDDGVFFYYISKSADSGYIPATVVAFNISYLDKDGQEQICEKCTSVGTGTAWTSGWYYVGSDITISDRITVTGDVHLILGDGATLSATKGITVATDNSLTIYAQSTGENMGKLVAGSQSENAAIGGASAAGGNITINGGDIQATGGYSAAGIGGGYYHDGGNIVIKGGTVTAIGGDYGAGIGGGAFADGGNITISGGTVTANGGPAAAGIGGGGGGNGGNITISGGIVNATGGKWGAGIGGGTNMGADIIVVYTSDPNRVKATAGSDADNYGDGKVSYDCYQVTFDSNGGSGDMGFLYISKNYTYAFPECRFTAPDGKQFKAWDIGGTEYAPGADLKVSRDTTVTAIWENIPAAKHTVSFAANEGSGSMTPVEVEDGTEYTLPACTFTAPSNKTFKAWSVGGEEKQPGDKITVSANTTVTAVWQNLVKYNLWVGGVQVSNVNASNITGEGITGAVSYDSTTKTLTLNNATITGAHEFSIFDDVSGIYGKETLKINLIGNNTITGSDNGGSSYGIYVDGNLTFTGTGSLTVSAADLSDNNWSVAVFADGSITVEESCTITAYCGANAWVASAFKSYAGSNAYNLPNATGILVAGNKNAPEATNFEVCNGDPSRFQYLRIAPGYTVTLNKNGGTINSGNVTCYFVDTGATLPTEVTKANNIFGGWYDNAECTGTAITEIPVGSTGEKEYWAKWTSTHTCSIEPVEKVWPDCENGGKEAYYKCEGCGKNFEDADGTTEIADIANWGNLPKTGHEYGTLKAAQPEIHTATELKAGVAAHYFCDVCDTYFTEDKVATDLDALTGTVPSHNYATVNGYKGEDGHADTCVCGAKDTVTAHTPDRAAATETDPVKCSVCEYEITPALGHTHKNLTKVPAETADCEKDGNIEYYTCTCGKWFADATASVEITDKDSVVIKGGHKYGTDWKSDEDNHWNECACGDKGNTAAHKDENADGKCDVCDYNVGLPTTPDGGNKPSDSPQTGDNTQLGLWIALLIVSSFGIVAITLFGKKKYSAR